MVDKEFITLYHTTYHQSSPTAIPSDPDYHLVPILLRNLNRSVWQVGNQANNEMPKRTFSEAFGCDSSKSSSPE